VIKSCVFALAALSLVFAVPAVSRAADAKEAFKPRVFEAPSGRKLRYRLMEPQNYDPQKKYPLVLFLHGAGERGDDNVIQLVHGMNDFAKDENREKYPCFVVAPQCPKGQQWVNVPWSDDAHTQPEKPSDPLQDTFDLLQALRKEFSIDSQRLYVTGLSMGGFGTWDLIQRHPDLFAAAAPICGGGDEKQAARLAKLPIWAFHGDQDTVVKPARSRNMIAAIKAAGGEPRHTEYPGVGHNSWAPAYSDPKLLEWLFAQRRE
jgi:predicted peptidase